MDKFKNFLHTVFVKSVWQTFFVAWIYQAFWKDLIVTKLHFDRWKGWVYLLPVIVLIAVFTIFLHRILTAGFVDNRGVMWYPYKGLFCGLLPFFAVS